MKKGSIALTNGSILRISTGKVENLSILIENGLISVIDKSKVVENIARNKNIPVVDLKNRVIMAGPIDTHFHLLQTGLHLSSVDLNCCKTIDEVLQSLTNKVKKSNENKWILAKGLDEHKLQEKRVPTLKELDSVSKCIPIFVEDRGIHYAILNTAAIKKLGFNEDIINNKLSKNEYKGVINGQFMEDIANEARHRLMQNFERKQIKEYLLEATKFAASCGITKLHAMEGELIFGDSEIPILLEMRDKLHVKMSLHWNTFNYKAVKKAGLKVIGGDIFLDGSIGSHTAAMNEPYFDEPDKKGLLFYKSEEIENFINACINEDLQVGFHAIGDRAIEQAISAFEKESKKNFVPNRKFRIDHFGCASNDHIRRAADLGIVIGTQPTFPFLRSDVYRDRLGKERERHLYPLRDFIKAGLLVAGSSDHVVAPAHVMLEIHAAVNHPHEEQRLSVKEALQMYTINAALIESEEDTKGTISVGKFGDLIVIDKNPFSISKKDIKDISIEMTIVNGEVVYQKE